MTDFRRLLEALVTGGVEFILVGGVAATVHGSTRLTIDVDIVYSRNPENLQRLVDTLSPLEPYLRGAPPGLPFHWDVETLKRGLSFTLIEQLIAVKRAAGRPKDFEAIAELEALVEERDKREGS